MPLFPWLTTLNIVTFGRLAVFTTVLCQGLIDAVDMSSDLRDGSSDRAALCHGL